MSWSRCSVPWSTIAVKECPQVKVMPLMRLPQPFMTMSETSSVNSMKSWNVNTVLCSTSGNMRKHLYSSIYHFSIKSSEISWINEIQAVGVIEYSEEFNLT